MLSCVEMLDNKDLNAVLGDIRLKTALRFPGCGELGELLESVKRILQSAELKEIFYTGGCTVFNEKEFVDASGDIKRVDRLILKNDEAWIVDYKSKYEYKEAYDTQINAYKNIVKGVYGNKRVRGFIVSMEAASITEI
jgi:ATP-dependent exoDNAse (exonuclease V) beta subunit